MNRLKRTFAELDRPAFISYVTACDPNYVMSLQVIKTLADNGADIIEIGMPFSDPMADGPVIQAANQRALAAHGDMKKTLQLVQDFRTYNSHVPIVLMGYYNPVLQYGLEEFVRDAARVGVDGLIIVDLPPEESEPLLEAIGDFDIDLIRLITPTTTPQRLPTLLKDARGFLYYVSITGVTGAAQADLGHVRAHIEEIKASTNLPIAIGFGIKTPEDAQKFAQIGDAVVVGSALVQTIADKQGQTDLFDALGAQVKAISSSLF